MLEMEAALGRIRRATGLPVAFGGAVAGDGRSMRLTEFAGTVTPALNGLVVSAGNGLGGRVVSTVRPAQVEDYAADPRISHEYDKPVTAEGLRAIAAVPVSLGGPALGGPGLGGPGLGGPGLGGPGLGGWGLGGWGLGGWGLGGWGLGGWGLGGWGLGGWGLGGWGLGGSVMAVLYAGTREPLAVGARALDAMSQVAARVATELTVRREVQRRLDELETAAARTRPAHAAPEWEDVRQAHADLRTIAQTVADPALRTRLQQVCMLLSGPTSAPPSVVPLSAREVDVLAMVAVGCTNVEAGRRLGLLPETVKSYLRNAMRKLGTHGRVETVAVARRHGFLP